MPTTQLSRFGNRLGGWNSHSPSQGSSRGIRLHGNPANAWSPCYTGTCQVGGIVGYNGNDGVDNQTFYPPLQSLPVTIAQYNTGQYVVLFPGNSAVPAGIAGDQHIRCPFLSETTTGGMSAQSTSIAYVNCGDI